MAMRTAGIEPPPCPESSATCSSLPRQFFVKAPCSLEWAADIEASVDQYAWNACECRCVADEPILLEKRRVPPIVRDEAREEQPERGIFKARIRSISWRQRNMGVFPGAPLTCRTLAHRDILAEKPLVVEGR